MFQAEQGQHTELGHGAGWGIQERKRTEREQRETRKPREPRCAAKKAGLFRNQRTWGKGREAQRLERFRVEGGACQP